MNNFRGKVVEISAKLLMLSKEEEEKKENLVKASEYILFSE